MKTLWARLMPNRLFVSSVALLASGTGLAQALVMLTAPVLTRLYTPEQFGAFGLYTAILAILTGIVTLRYEMAIPLPESEAESFNLVALCCLNSLGTALMTAIGVWLLGGRIEAWTGAPGLQSLLALLPLGLFLCGISQAVEYWSTRRALFGRIAQAGLAENSLQVMGQSGLGWVGAGALGLVLGRLVAVAGRVALMLVDAWRDRPSRLISWAQVRQVAYRYRRFPLLAAGAGLLNSIGLQLAPLMLTGLYGAQVAGWFALGQRMVGAPMALLGRAVSQVYTGEVARSARTEPAAVWRLFWRTAFQLSLIGSPPILLLGIAGPTLFSLLFGSAWREAGTYTQVLTGMTLVQFVVVPLSYTLDALERQDLQLAWDVGRLAVVLGALLLSMWLKLTPHAGILLYGLAMTISYLVLFLLSALAIRTANARLAPQPAASVQSEVDL